MNELEKELVQMAIEDVRLNGGCIRLDVTNGKVYVAYDGDKVVISN